MSASSEQTIHHYRQRAYELVSKYENVDVSDLQKVLRDTLDYRAKVLELGCGSGRDAAFLKRFSNIREITATDACPEMIAQAGRLHPDIAGNLLELTLPHGLLNLLRERKSYGGIFSVAALMHLEAEDIAETLEHCELLLEPGGVLFLSVSSERPVNAEADPRQFTLKPAEWWQKEIENAGMRIVEIKETADSLNRADVKWLNITAVK